jgi:hypothetical protein
MIGWIYAMTPADYQQWLETGAAEGSLAAQAAQAPRRTITVLRKELPGRAHLPFPPASRWSQPLASHGPGVENALASPFA